MENIKMLAYDFLSKSKLDSLPITLEKLNMALEQKNSALLPYSKAEQILDSLPETVKQEMLIGMKMNKGITLVLNNGIIILYSDELSYSERLLVVAHEIGHNCLSHKRVGIHVYTNAENDKHEMEAQVFAYYLLAPPCILQKTGASCTDRISQLTGLDRYASAIVFDTLQRERNNTTTALEIALLHQFNHFIKNNKNSLSMIKNTSKGKYLVCIISLAVILSLGASLFSLHTSHLPASRSLPPAQAKETFTAQETVWKAKTGTIYHTDPTCYHITPTSYPMDINDAIRAGYRKCKDCKQ